MHTMCMFNIPVNRLLTMMPVSSMIKQRGMSIEAPGFRVPIVVSDIPHQAIELFDSKLNSKSILLSLQVHEKSVTNNLAHFRIVIITYEVFIMWHLQLTGSSR